MELKTLVIGPAILTWCAILMFLGFVDALELAILGDPWAAGVAYDSSNVYQPGDTEACNRNKKAWGLQMANDNSGSLDPQGFQFDACGGPSKGAISSVQLKKRLPNPDCLAQFWRQRRVLLHECKGFKLPTHFTRSSRSRFVQEKHPEGGKRSERPEKHASRIHEGVERYHHSRGKPGLE